MKSSAGKRGELLRLSGGDLTPPLVMRASVFVQVDGQRVSRCQPGSLRLCEHPPPPTHTHTPSALIDTEALTRREVGGASGCFVTERRAGQNAAPAAAPPPPLCESSPHCSRWSVGGHQPLRLSLSCVAEEAVVKNPAVSYAAVLPLTSPPGGPEPGSLWLLV